MEQANGHRVMTVSPRYDQYMDAWDTSVSVDVMFLILLNSGGETDHVLLALQIQFK